MQTQKQYQKPALKSLGKISKLTLANGSAGGDSNMNKNGNGN